MRTLALALLIALSGSSCATAERLAPAQTRVEQQTPRNIPRLVRGRFFEEQSFPGVIFRLAFDYPGYVDLIEIDPITLEAESGVLRAWVQHCPPAGCVYPTEALEADVIISCFPSGQSPEVRWLHVLPYHAGSVWIYGLGNDRIYVSADEEPFYTFLVREGTISLRVEG